ncbi:glycerol kinase GlpK [Peptoniphilus stercorisuis]|uniref:Glycerol kinase n=1 Tax=Peptoniphilus stercorisuis TaxID=1436965 RepID=A0ABS4KAQ7_9FIRM|nr:glycerol kinase GlpK [Peptoniphilus stercorisuis]MBP2024862.1 glycerol kinase [Peptoniphilus stercorisuis]
MKKYIMAIDSGTTSNRCIIFNKKGEIVSSSQKEFKQYFPQPGWVEQDADEIWSNQIGVCVEAINKANIKAEEISSIGITNQRETTIIWNKKTGIPIYNAIVWQCRRTSNYCDELKNKGYTEKIKEKTGLLIDAYFSATKIKWILENVEGAKEQAEKGELLFGTVDTWLIYKLTGGKTHATDYSNASRTMLYNINELKWDEEILQLLEIPKEILPEVRNSSGNFGKVIAKYFGGEIEITGVAGDQQSALFGQICLEEGEAKNTYGTGAFLLMNTGRKKIESKKGLLSTIAWGIDGKITYALEGSIFVAGSAVQWLRDDLKIIDSSEDSEYMATKVEDTNDCYIVPAFTGLGAPYWDQYARGTIVGLTRGVNKYHIIRATLESIALLSQDVLHVMEKECNGKLKKLKVDGGASANNFMMQFQSDITNTKVVRPKLLESTARGAAFLAGIHSGFWTIEEIQELEKDARIFIPKMSEEERNKKIKRWHRAVEYSKNWAKED